MAFLASFDNTGLVLERWIGAPDFLSEWVETGSTSLKRKRIAFENIYRSMPFACASGLWHLTGFRPRITVPPEQERRSSMITYTRLARADHCAAEADPIGLPRIVMPSGRGRPATLKLAATSSARRRR